VAAVDGVRTVSPVRFTQARTGGDAHSVVGIDPETFGELYDAGDGDEVLSEVGPGTTVVSADYAEEDGLAVGDAVTLRTAQRQIVKLRVAGIIDDKGLLRGDFTVTNQVLEDKFGAEKDGLLFAAVDDPGRTAEVQDAVEQALKQDFPQVEALTKDEFGDDFAGRINKLLALIYALLALTVIVALFGIVNTLVLSITERTRELGMLRAIGTSRRQVRGMIRMEAVIMSLIGGILGVVLGTGLALLVSRAVDDLTLSIPVVTVLALLLLAAVAGVLASVIPARRAARLDVLRALAYE
jgi:putative ABC transport system permease protein